MFRSKRYLPAALTMGLILAALPAKTTAEDNTEAKAEAKQHFQTGLDLMKSEDLEGAAKELELSVDSYPNKNNLFNLANCYRALNRPAEALKTFERVKAEFGDKLEKEMRDDIDKKMRELKAQMATLRITVSPEGATVKVDGEEVGTTPLTAPLVLAEGEHDIEVSIDNYETAKRKVELAAGANKVISIELQEQKAKATAALTINANEPGAEVIDATPVKPVVETPPTTKPAAVSEPPSEAATDLPAEHKDERTRGAITFGVGLAGTIIMSGVTAAMWGVGVKKKNDYIKNNKDLNEEWSAELDQETSADRKAANSYNKAAVGTTIAASGFLLMTIIGAVVKGRNKEPSTVAFSPTPGGMEVSF